MVGKKILVIGMNPSNKPTLNGKTSATFKRLEKWMDSCEVKHFSFANTFDYPKDNPTHLDVDYQKLCTLIQGYDKIIAMGGFVSRALNKINAPHFEAPHPSPRNRKFNDPSFEPTFIMSLRKYVTNN